MALVGWLGLFLLALWWLRTFPPILAVKLPATPGLVEFAAIAGGTAVPVRCQPVETLSLGKTGTTETTDKIPN